MTNPYRAMCAELVDALDNLFALVNGECPSLLDGDRGGSGFLDIEIDDALTAARALLAQPVAEGPTDEELEDLAEVMNVSGNPVPAMRRALELWGRPTPQPEGSDIHYSWELHDAEGEWQAGGSAITLESVRREGNHYLQTYSQDGPHTLIIYQASTIEVVTND